MSLESNSRDLPRNYYVFIGERTNFQGPNSNNVSHNTIESSTAHIGSALEASRFHSESCLSILAENHSGADTKPLTDRDRTISLPEIPQLREPTPFPQETTGSLGTGGEGEGELEIFEEAEFLAMPPSKVASSSDDDKPDSQGTIIFTGDEKLRYDRISDQGLFYRGRLIQVSEVDADASISGCSMIVLAVSKHGFPQCLMLCRHHGQEGDDEEADFWQAHSPLYSSASSKGRIPAYENGKQNKPITVRITKPSSTKLADNCFINYQHTWCLRKEHVKAAPIGKVTGDDLKNMIDCYKRVQQDMYAS